ncbi:MFS transporter [Marinomonas pollencensis]|uniref:Putative MFS family arabinose efflux permease n=1 Tax=Marinomonas pollencensis TaxID=491954 RepID=A0A3E0DNG3_9GAMM|nr:MFS transporter [Marinomonas pollencensis]REG83716.1 putative MFS family arabinose efflux permease [Marinomonas pollencensis]
MSLQTSSIGTSQQEEAGPSRSLLFSLAVGAGLSVAAIYYNQPMLGNIGQDFHANVSTTGLVPTLTQIGYALGILLLIPLGDRFNRRHVILAKGLMLTLALILCSFMPSLNGMLVASLIIGIMATMAQDIVPTAAILAPDAQRGKAVGTVMTGLLIGILLSRVVSGVVTEVVGWRVMYQAAAASILAISLVLWRVLPNLEVQTRVSYFKLMRSMLTLWILHPTLRRAAFSQGLLALAFSAFWSTLAVMLQQNYGFGSATAGAFGLAGAAGALAAPLAGRLTDKQGPSRVTQVGAALVVFSFVIMFYLPYLSVNGQIALILVSAFGFDFGVQAALVSHQTLIYGIDPTARGRLNALFFTCMFIGMAVGSALGSLALMSLGWSGVVSLATIAGILSLIIRMTERSE